MKEDMDSEEPKEIPKVEHKASRLGSMNDMAYCGHSEDMHALSLPCRWRKGNWKIRKYLMRWFVRVFRIKMGIFRFRIIAF